MWLSWSVSRCHSFFSDVPSSDTLLYIQSSWSLPLSLHIELCVTAFWGYGTLHFQVLYLLIPSHPLQYLTSYGKRFRNYCPYDNLFLSLSPIPVLRSGTLVHFCTKPHSRIVPYSHRVAVQISFTGAYLQYLDLSLLCLLSADHLIRHLVCPDILFKCWICRTFREIRNLIIALKFFRNIRCWIWYLFTELLYISGLPVSSRNLWSCAPDPLLSFQFLSE